MAIVGLVVVVHKLLTKQLATVVGLTRKFHLYKTKLKQKQIEDDLIEIYNSMKFFKFYG